MRNDDARPLASTGPRPLLRGGMVGILAILAAFGAASGRAVRASESAEPLFRLVPPESSMVLAVEDFRSRIKQFGEATLASDLKKLPRVVQWLASDGPDRFRRSVHKIEVALGVPIATVVDQIFGDAVILVLQSAPEGMVDRSAGLLLIRPRQPKLLERLITARNITQDRKGNLIQVGTRRQGNVTYQSRLFRPGGWPSDHYVFFDDGTFAWSNSEAMIVEVIDRRAGVRPGWDASPGFARVRRGLPERSLASLYVAPAFLAKMLGATPRGGSGPLRPLSKLATPYCNALLAIGFALEWREGLVIHSHDVLDPGRLPPGMANWMTRPPRPSPLLDLVPESSLGLIAARFDFAEAFRIVRTLREDEDRAAWEAVEQVMQGIALGQPVDGLLGRVDPHLVVTLGGKTGPASRGWFTIAGGVAWVPAGRLEPPWQAADNALRTGMALYALHPDRRAHHLRVETRDVAGRPVARLGTAERSLLAAQSLPDRLVVGNTPEAIGQFGGSTDRSAAGSPLDALRARYAAGCETFAVFDIPGLIEAVERSRGPIVNDLAGRANRPITEVERDLNEFLALAQFFRGLVLTSKANPDATEVHRTVGLIAR